MAGVTDRPFRSLCRRLGAGLAVGEMISADPRMRRTRKSRQRADHAGENAPRAIQIAGADPQQMADAARWNVQRGAQIIDVNMGCPAKKVCKAHAGSALLSDTSLVARILEAVVSAVSVPVTLKIRTGPEPARRNGVQVAHIAEQAGVSALAVHGRTRACRFEGEAEYDTIRDIVREVAIPVLANGDVTTPEQAERVLSHTGAAGVMVGRGAQGNPWIFREIDYFLENGKRMAPPSLEEVRETLTAHLVELYAFYGRELGPRVARKHLSWYCAGKPGASAFWERVSRVTCCDRQLAMVEAYYAWLAKDSELAA